MRQISTSSISGTEEKPPMGWEEFLNLILDEKQIKILRCALKINNPVYFYGAGLGKGVITTALINAGYSAAEPATLSKLNINCDSVPDGTNYICFNIKKNSPRPAIPGLYDDLAAQKEEIIRWVNQV